MPWKKLGLVYVARGKFGWDRSHAYVPTPIVLKDRVRVYVAFLDSNQIGRVGYVDLSMDNPLKIIGVSRKPVLDVGRKGSFDEHGVSPMSVITENGKYFMFYTGWKRNPEKGIRYTLFTGLAYSEDATRFSRYSNKPLLPSSKQERYIRSAAFVMRESNTYKMWYAGGSEWVDYEGKLVPSYKLKYLESDSLTNWGQNGRVIMDFANRDEYGFGRPWVIKEDGIYKMWYSVRTFSKGYRIGYAESEDGIKWTRMDDKVGIDVSKEGWDSQMICFASVININGRRYLLYNGNNYGETGFGLAIWE
jgi:predicted GH43/DUF377 family glycosyl hydrolase